MLASKDGKQRRQRCTREPIWNPGPRLKIIARRSRPNFVAWRTFPGKTHSLLIMWRIIPWLSLSKTQSSSISVGAPEGAGVLPNMQITLRWRGINGSADAVAPSWEAR